MHSLVRHHLQLYLNAYKQTQNDIQLLTVTAGTSKKMKFSGNLPPETLGNAEQFLLSLSAIPNLSERLRLWMFTLDYHSMEKDISEPLMDLSVAMKEIEESATFRTAITPSTSHLVQFHSLMSPCRVLDSFLIKTASDHRMTVSDKYRVSISDPAPLEEGVASKSGLEGLATLRGAAMRSAVSPVHRHGFQEAALGVHQLGDSKLTNQLRIQQLQEVAARQLQEAKAKPVLFAIRASVAYDGALDDDVPVPGSAISFDVGHFLHIIRFNENWWIGRLVKDGAELGFVPSPSKLEQLKEHKRRRLLSANSCFATRLEDEAPYDVVPSMRPIIFVGPALKGYTVTDMMHKAIFDFLKERFRDRIIISRVVVDLDVAGKASPNKLLLSRNSIKKGEQRVSWLMEETERIYKMCRLMQLVVLDCDQVNHPGQLHKSSIAPIMVHIKVSNQKVLQRLIKERGKKKSRAMKVQMLNAEKLGQCPDSLFDLIVDDNQLEDACEHIADFLEIYWRATHPSF
ncbi:hypothetical protein QR680_009007 [Steinernema hermaphroditum]|uniref:Guanylate kinase/L-type calcium channel beta subunit domain-containing protein n=1 Tax=Steinernema hermaphroditum TaxID=289476 RepID=A0AA39M834_9BILA|nr:hypothetical protein QR680_009007 [Steinernema hermaphroditum]